MGNMNKHTHDILYPQIVENQGAEICNNPKCPHRKKQWWILGAKKPELVIDHKDNNNSNNSIVNLQLLCRSCNTRKNHPRTVEPTTRNAPPEFIAGKKNIKKFKKYLYGRLEEPESNGAVNYEDVVDDASNFIDCTQQSIKNYIQKLKSKRHGLITTEDRNGELFIVWKNDVEMDEVMHHPVNVE